MKEVRYLEKARKSLSKAETSLESSINKAHRSILTLNIQLSSSKLAYAAAKKRHIKLFNLTRAICDNCWVILPTVSKEVQTAASNTSSRPAACMNCGGIFSFEKGSILMPPESTSILQEADEECRKADDTIKKTKTGRCLLDSDEEHHPDSVQRSWVSETNEEYETDLNLEGLHKKDFYLNKAWAQRNDTKLHFRHLAYALDQWSKYRNQHEEELEKVKAKIDEVTDCERDLLESKLDKLGGSKRKRESLTENSCTICQERQKEIVFQCGHQCCSTCSESLDRCHACRARISQRIKLFD